MSRDEFAKFIDHTILKPETTDAEIKKLCKEAVEFGFGCVFIPPCYVRLASSILRKTEVSVGTISGFPLGSSITKVKMLEAREAVKHGADEIDMVMNIGALKSKNYELVKRDIKKVLKTVGEKTIVKVILECSVLSNEEKIKATELAMKAGAHFVKTSTGFFKSGATLEDVKLLKSVVGDLIGVKASGGIRTLEQAMALIQAGATRIGTSAGVEIMKQFEKKN